MPNIGEGAFEYLVGDPIITVGAEDNSAAWWTVFSNYFRYFHGKYLVAIHRTPHYSDAKADMVIIDEPGHVLEQLGY